MSQGRYDFFYGPKTRAADGMVRIEIKCGDRITWFDLSREDFLNFADDAQTVAASVLADLEL